MTTIKELLDKGIAFMGSDWVKDESAVDSPLKGYRYAGEVPCVNANDLFYWGVADGVEIRDEDIPIFDQALIDCEGNFALAGDLYCARKEKMRPQGAVYSSIPKKFWGLFDACGPEREIDRGNPYGQLKTWPPENR
jgi:hypothetical protein